jgi:hypothetical protein
MRNTRKGPGTGVPSNASANYTTGTISPSDGNGLDLDLDGSEHIDERIRLSRDLMLAAGTMGDAEARYLVDAYYMTQEARKRTDNQTRSFGLEEPHVLIAWLAEKNRTIEHQIARALDAYTMGHLMGSWMRDIVGIGPVLSAGLLAHIYMGPACSICRAHDAASCAARQTDPKNKKKPWMLANPNGHSFVSANSCPTVGHIWQFAGIAGDGQKPWEKGKIRPFNGQLKVLCWKVGQSFMKLSGRPDCYYGRVYRERKLFEVANSEAGRLSAQAAKQLPHFDKATESYKWYAQGKLPPAHLDARARRYAVKLFLSHLHGEWHQRKFGVPAPLPYPIAFLSHVHFIPPEVGLRPTPGLK